jgi:hypothetical protein
VLQRLRDSRVFTLALAVALGFSLWDVASGISTLVAGLAGNRYEIFNWATWHIGGHTFTFEQFFRGLIEVTVIGALAFVVMRRERTPTPIQP